MSKIYLQSAIKQFNSYKSLAEGTFEQLIEEQFFWQYNEESNSVATIITHMWGNMLSRWTDFLKTDGEKEWRQRDIEFEKTADTKAELMLKWEEGWKCLFNTLNQLSDSDLQKEVIIRNQGHSVLDAINRQLAHYAYHIGQIVFVGKMLRNAEWISLSIPKGKSKEYNTKLFFQSNQK